MNTQIIYKYLKGNMGLNGEKGLRGQQGFQGCMGPLGPPGSMGVKGEKGSIGREGNIGFKGLRGDKGRTGSIGIKGNIGNIGKTGPEGMKGGKGNKGDIGLKGNIGNSIEGEKGEKGNYGNLGDKGIKGEKGSIGEIIYEKNLFQIEFNYYFNEIYELKNNKFNLKNIENQINNNNQIIGLNNIWLNSSNSKSNNNIKNSNNLIGIMPPVYILPYLYCSLFKIKWKLCGYFYKVIDNKFNLISHKDLKNNISLEIYFYNKLNKLDDFSRVNTNLYYFDPLVISKVNNNYIEIDGFKNNVNKYGGIVFKQEIPIIDNIEGCIELKKNIIAGSKIIYYKDLNNNKTNKLLDSNIGTNLVSAKINGDIHFSGFISLILEFIKCN